MQACAGPRRDEGDTWISERIEASYRQLHARGAAHSIECWQDGQLFSRVPDASKVALAWLVAALRRAGARLLDCQFMTEHLASLGAVEITQAEYLVLLRAAQSPTAGDAAGLGVAAGLGDGAGLGTGVGEPLALPEGFAALLGDAAAAGLSSSPGNFIAQSLTQTS